MGLVSSVKTDASTWNSISNIWVKEATKWAKAQNMFVKVGPDTWKRAWPQLPENMIVMYPDTLPADWLVCDGLNSTPDLIDSFPQIAAAVGAKTGSNTHSTGSSTSFTTTSSNPSVERYADDDRADIDVLWGFYSGEHNHVINSHVHGSVSHVPVYAAIQFAVIKTDFEMKPSLIIFYWDLLGQGEPAGWSFYDTYAGKFLRGSASSSWATGGAAQHRHYSSGTSAADSWTDYHPVYNIGATFPFSASNHTHSINHYTDYKDNQPKHVTLQPITPLSENSILPHRAIALFADTPPQGWKSFAASGTPNITGNLIKLGASNVSILGSDTHTDSVSSSNSWNESALPESTGRTDGNYQNKYAATYTQEPGQFSGGKHGLLISSHSHGSATSVPVHTPVILAIKTELSFIGQMTRWTFDSNAADALGFRDATVYGTPTFQNINGENVCTMDQSDTQYIEAFSGWDSDLTLGQDMRDFTILGRFEGSTTSGDANATIAARGAYWKIEIDQSASGDQTVSFYVDGSVIETATAPYGNPYSYAMVFHSNGDVDCYFNGALVGTTAGQTFTATDNIPITLGRDVNLANPARGHWNGWMTFNMALRAIDIALIDEDYDQWVDAGMGTLTDYVEAVDEPGTYVDPS